MEQSPSSEAINSSSSQEILRILRKPKFHCCVQNSLSLVLIQCQINTVLSSQYISRRSCSVLSSHPQLGLKVVSFLRVSSPKPHTHHSYLSHVPRAFVVTGWRVFRCGWGRRLPDLERNCKYTDYAVVDCRQGGPPAWRLGKGIKNKNPSRQKLKSFSKCAKEPWTWTDPLDRMQSARVWKLYNKLSSSMPNITLYINVTVTNCWE
jgi:hypothetical protein